MKIVYASSTEEGMFDELVVLDKSQIISDDEETEDGTLICVYVLGGEEFIFYYIDKTEI